MHNPDQSTVRHLLDRERIRGATRMIPDGTPPDQVTADQIQQVCHQVNKHAKAAGISCQQVARAIGLKSGGVISEVINGKYRGDTAGVVIQLDDWLECEYKAQDALRTARFVWTGVAEEIRMVANIARGTKRIAKVYGPDTSGIGKTMAFEAVKAETPGSVLVTIVRVHASPTGLLRAVSRAMFKQDFKRNADLYDTIVTAPHGTRRLLVIDQIHNLRGAKGDRPLFVLADLFDATGAPQLWGGTVGMVDYLNRAQSRGDETLAQIRSRIFYQLDLVERTRSRDDGGRDEPLYRVEEVWHIFGKNKVRLTTDAVRYIIEVANLLDGGGLRTAVNVVTVATTVATQSNAAQIDADLLRSAFRGSTTKAKFDLINERLDEARPMTMRAVAG